MILGLDVSTSCTGWAVTDENENLIEHGYIKLSKCKDMIDKAELLCYTLERIMSKYSIDKIGIENILKKSAVGSASVITILATFNGMSQILCYKTFKIKPELISFAHARKKFNIKRESKSQKYKEAVFQYIIKNYPNFAIEYNKNDKIRDESMDSSDALLIAKYVANTIGESNNERESRTPKKKVRRVRTG